MFDLAEKIFELQAALELNDQGMSDYLGVNVTVLREAKLRTQDLSSHGAAIVLESLGILKISNATMTLLTLASRKKYTETTAKHALSTKQKSALQAIKAKYAQDSK